MDDRQAVITFAKPFSDWRGMFAGNTMLLPKSMTANPEAFNTGQLNGPGPSAGPFMVSGLDRDRAANHVDTQPEMVGYATAARQHHLPGARRRGAHSRHCRTTPSTPPASPRSTNGERPQHPGHLDPPRARRQLVSLHLQRRARIDPGGQGAAAGSRQGHRPAGHRQRHPARAGRQPGAAEQPHLRRRPRGLPGQQRRRRLRPREGQAGTRRSRMAPQRSVPREGRPPAGDPRRALRRADDTSRSARSPRTASRRSA